MNDDDTSSRATRQKARLAAALRHNLKRRKAQAKSRAASEAVGQPPHDSAGIGDDKQNRERG